MPCVQLNTNAHLDVPQMPVGVPNTMALWLRSATLGAFGELFLSETGTINATAHDGVAGLDTAKFFVTRKTDGRTDAAVGGTANTWYYWVFSSEDSSTYRVRIFADDGPTFTKLADWTRSFTGTDKRYAAINASNGNIRVTGLLIHYGGVITDAEVRAQMVTRVATTPAAGTSWAAFDLTSHTDLTDTIGANDATSTGTTSTVSGDQPAAYTVSGGSVAPRPVLLAGARRRLADDEEDDRARRAMGTFVVATPVWISTITSAVPRLPTIQVYGLARREAQEAEDHSRRTRYLTVRRPVRDIAAVPYVPGTDTGRDVLRVKRHRMTPDRGGKR